MPEPMLRLLGGIECSPPGGGATQRIGRKPQALLALVAASGTRGVAREHLVDLLWPDLDPAAGAAALRQCLYQLRKSLGECAQALDAGRDRVAVREGLADARVFEELATSDDARSLSHAARMFRGDFCEGFEAVEDEVAQLIAAERTRLRLIAHRLAARIADGSFDAATTEHAVDLSHRLQARDPLNEGGQRSLMKLLERRGMRAEALNAYERFRKTLRRELGVDPSAETVALARALREPVSQISRTEAHSRRDPGGSGAREGTNDVPVVAHTLAFPNDVSPAAADHLLRAIALFRQLTADTNRQARDAAETAARIDPPYTEALVWQGWTHLFDWIFGWAEAPEESHRLTRACAERGLSLAPNRAPPHLLMAETLVWEMKHGGALEHAAAARKIAPYFPGAVYHHANILVYSGQHAEGLEQARRARDLVPDEEGYNLTVEARALFLLGELAEARKCVERAIVRNPPYILARVVAIAIESDLGNYDAARAEVERVNRICPRLLPPPLLLESDRERFARSWTRVGFHPRRTPGAKIVSVASRQPLRRKAAE